MKVFYLRRETFCDIFTESYGINCVFTEDAEIFSLDFCKMKLSSVHNEWDIYFCAYKDGTELGTVVSICVSFKFVRDGVKCKSFSDVNSVQIIDHESFGKRLARKILFIFLANLIILNEIFQAT